MATQALHSALRHVRRKAESADMRLLSDRQLLERYHVQRDEAAFAALVRRHSRLVISAIRQVLTEPADTPSQFSFLLWPGVGHPEKHFGDPRSGHAGGAAALQVFRPPAAMLS